jgi:transcriptional regulator GlxA family with amidase domain
MPQKSFAFLLLPGASMLNFSSAIEPLRIANQLAAQPLYSWHTLSPDGAAVTCSNGTALTVDGPLASAPQADYAFIVAGPAAQYGNQAPVISWLRRKARFGGTLGAVSGGTGLLAEAGLLKSGAFTLHWEDRLAFSERFPGLEPLDQLNCADGQILTCSGGTATLDLSLHLIARHHGPRFARTVSDLCVHSGPRGGQERPQSSLSYVLGSRSPHLVKAAAIMAGNLEEPLQLKEVDRQSDISRRHMERLFSTHTGRTPAHYYRDLRLERGRKLLSQTDYRLPVISAACGYSSTTTFSRNFKRRFGIAPVDYQSQSQRRPAAARA